MAVPIFGVLGESTLTSGITTTTVYTAGSGRAARIRIKFANERDGATGGYAYRAGMPGSETTWAGSSSANIDFFTGIPASAQHLVQSAMSINELSLGNTLVQDNADRASVLPLPVDEFLSPADTVQMINPSSGSQNDMLFQVLGTEYDSA